jgi:hypothetical protein
MQKNSVSKKQKTHYAIKRMAIASYRMMGTTDPQQKILAAKWATAWGVLAGANAPERMALRAR